MPKILITGASGFIGKALTKYLLSKNIEIYAVVRDQEKLANLKKYTNLHIIQCEMSEYQNLPHQITERNFDVCFHLAWEGEVGHGCQDVGVQIKNTKSSSELLHAFKELNGKYFLFANTISQYKYNKIKYTNYEITSNFDIYGIMKQTTEAILKKYALQSDITFNSVILSNIFGTGDYSKRSINIIIDKLLRGESPTLADGSNLYDWVYIDDAIQAILAVVEKGCPYKTYYIGYRKLKTFEEIVTMVRDIINPSIPLTFGTYHDTSFIDYDQFFNDDLYQDTGFEISSDFVYNIRKTVEWVKTLNF